MSFEIDDVNNSAPVPEVDSGTEVRDLFGAGFITQLEAKFSQLEGLRQLSQTPNPFTAAHGTEQSTLLIDRADINRLRSILEMAQHDSFPRTLKSKLNPFGPYIDSLGITSALLEQNYQEYESAIQGVAESIERKAEKELSTEESIRLEMEKLQQLAEELPGQAAFQELELMAAGGPEILALLSERRNAYRAKVLKRVSAANHVKIARQVSVNADKIEEAASEIGDWYGEKRGEIKDLRFFVRQIRKDGSDVFESIREASLRLLNQAAIETLESLGWFRIAADCMDDFPEGTRLAIEEFVVGQTKMIEAGLGANSKGSPEIMRYLHNLTRSAFIESLEEQANVRQAELTKPLNTELTLAINVLRGGSRLPTPKDAPQRTRELDEAIYGLKDADGNRLFDIETKGVIIAIALNLYDRLQSILMRINSDESDEALNIVRGLRAAEIKDLELLDLSERLMHIALVATSDLREKLESVLTIDEMERLDSVITRLLEAV